MANLLIVSFLTFLFTPQVENYSVECDLVATYQVKDASPGKSDGEITLSISGGKAPYEVRWVSYNFSEKGEHIKNLKEGYYTAIVVDANKCTKAVDNIHVQSKSNME